MFNLTTQELQAYINEDIPYFDLTTSLQNCSNTQARMDIYTREDIVVACSEEAAKIAEHFNCTILSFKPSQTKAKQQEVLLSYEGEYAQVHQAYRLTQILLEYSCKIATQAWLINQKIKAVNPHCELLTTRKTFPFAKKFCIKAAMMGGAMPHRLGLSETILFFDAHRVIYDSNSAFYTFIQELKNNIVEKKIVVESETTEDAIALMQHGADVLQLDKLSFEDITKIVTYKNENFSQVKILAAGGININNVERYVQAGVDSIVTSWVYQAGMANLGAKFQLKE